MLSLYDLQSQVKEALNINSIESTVSDELITDLINIQRSLAIRNEYNKNRAIDPYVQQTLPCIPLELVSPHTCCIEVPIGCKILRSVYQIPNTIEFNFTKAISSIGPVDITRPRFNMVSYSRVPYIGHGRTTKNNYYAFIYDQYLYVISKNPAVNTLKYVTMQGIFEDPTFLSTIQSCDGAACWHPGLPYPLNQWMWAYIKPFVIQEIAQKLPIPTDDSNDTEDANTERGMTNG
jgi:hypothetical protein